MKKNLLLLPFLAATTSLNASPMLSVGDHTDIFFVGTLGAEYTDNLFLNPDSLAEEDFIFTFTPGISVEVGRGLTNAEFRFLVANEIRRYNDFDDNNSELWNIRAVGSYRASRYRVRGALGYRETLAADEDDEVADRLTRADTYTANAALRYTLSPRTSFGVGGNYVNTEFDTSGNVDRQSITVPLDLFYEITPKLDGSFGFRYRQTDVDRVDSDRESFFFNVGLDGALTEKFTTDLRVGYQVQTYESDRDDDGLLTMIATADWDVAVRSRITASVDRDFAVSGDGNSVERTGLRGTYFYLISPFWNADLTLAYTLSEYLTSSREDDTYRIQIGSSYQISENIDLRGSYLFRTNQSNRNSAEYDENRVELSASIRY